MLFSLGEVNRHLEENSLPFSSKLSTLSSSENSVCVFQHTGRHIINKYFERNVLAVTNNESIFFLCGASSQRGPWPPHS